MNIGCATVLGRRKSGIEPVAFPSGLDRWQLRTIFLASLLYNYLLHQEDIDNFVAVNNIS
jgi:hypothetical protein